MRISAIQEAVLKGTECLTNEGTSWGSWYCLPLHGTISSTIYVSPICYIYIPILSKQKKWVINSGCTSYVTCDWSTFNNFKPLASFSTSKLCADPSAVILGRVNIFLIMYINGAIVESKIRNNNNERMFKLFDTSIFPFQICRNVALRRVSAAKVLHFLVTLT